ncbi:hypothetical protein Cgig2_011501 [Carnegiea gigantea]|uniref:NAF domain-containing protein n=1 Tax=Carnegiea gigantea TaxID=171969 RepID=A0A9Q1GS28_9CARY|nr:hypothetical protein Cgig2_011501 [Carnegiea gigantea]
MLEYDPEITYHIRLAQRMIKRIPDPNPITRIPISEIKAGECFRKVYTPATLGDGEDKVDIDEACSINEVHSDDENAPCFQVLSNVFQLIGMSSFLDLSGFFVREDVSERKIRFTSNLAHKKLLARIENIVTRMGYHVQKKNGQVFKISPSLCMVELRKSFGDSSVC